MDVKNKTSFTKFWFVILSCFIINTISCKEEKKEQKPNYVIGRDTMVLILTEIHLLESSLGIRVIEDVKIKNTRNLVKAKIYKDYSVSKEQFFKSYNYYTQRPAVIDSIYIDVISEISKKQAEQIKK
jgi:hypothetical protein